MTPELTNLDDPMDLQLRIHHRVSAVGSHGAAAGRMRARHHAMAQVSVDLLIGVHAVAGKKLRLNQFGKGFSGEKPVEEFEDVSHR